MGAIRLKRIILALSFEIFGEILRQRRLKDNSLFGLRVL